MVPHLPRIGSDGRADLNVFLAQCAERDRASVTSGLLLRKRREIPRPTGLPFEDDCEVCGVESPSATRHPASKAA
jgi:hypothetical protein